MWLRLIELAEPAIVPKWGVLYVNHGDQMTSRIHRYVAEAGRFRRKRAVTSGEDPLAVDELDRMLTRGLRRTQGRMAALRYVGRRATEARSPVALWNLGARALFVKPVRGPIARPRPSIPALADEALDQVRGIVAGAAPEHEHSSSGPGP
jgi:hypothetical protein